MQAFALLIDNQLFQAVLQEPLDSLTSSVTLHLIVYKNPFASDFIFVRPQLFHNASIKSWRFLGFTSDSSVIGPIFLSTTSYDYLIISGRSIQFVRLI